MTNGEKYKTAEERAKAFKEFCGRQKHSCEGCPLQHKGGAERFAWLDLEAEEEKPMPCPFCGSETRVVPFKHMLSQVVRCTSADCGYTSTRYATTDLAIASHNRVCKAVAAHEGSKIRWFEVGDTIAYRSFDDNQPEWKSFTVRLIKDGYLYENKDCSGDNIAIACAHKVDIRKESEVK